jgi:hypothetical protein
MTNATYEQLIQIVFAEDCSLDDKYNACREMHMRKHQDTKLSDPAIRNLSGYLKDGSHPSFLPTFA